MSKPKIIWLPGTDQTCTIGYCTYSNGVKIALDHELKSNPRDPNSRDKFRIRCLLPRKEQLSKPVTFSTETEAREQAEREARRLYQNLPVIDYNLISEWRAKAQIHDEVLKIYAPIGRKPDQAAYELVHLYEMTKGRHPTEIVSLYLDLFERVKTIMTLKEVIEKRIKRIENSKKLMPPTKVTYTNGLRDFGAGVGLERLVKDLTCEDIDDWYCELLCGAKAASDRWSVVREALSMAYTEYGAITRWRYEQFMALDYFAKSGTCSVVMPVPLLKGLFEHCEYANDALYLGILSWIPLRRAELCRLDWKYIDKWKDGRPRIFHLPQEMAKGEVGYKEERFIDIPPMLADLLLCFWRDSGPIIVGDGHQERLAELAKKLDNNFKAWPHNLLRRSCISYGVYDTLNPEYRGSDYWCTQAGHDKESQERYLVPVDPLRAREFRTYSPDLNRLASLPYAFSDAPAKRGRPSLTTPESPASEPQEIAAAVVETPQSLEPAVARESGNATEMLEVSMEATPAKLPEIPAGNGANQDRPGKGTELIVDPKAQPAAPTGSETDANANTEEKNSFPELARGKPLPPPPRRPCQPGSEPGHIDWKGMSIEYKTALFQNHEEKEIAKAWNVNVNSVYKQVWQLWPATRSPCFDEPMPWDGSKAKFLHMLWEEGAVSIARRLGCNPCTVKYYAKQLDLEYPNYSWWKLHNRQIPPHILAQMAELDAEEAAVLAAQEGGNHDQR